MITKREIAALSVLALGSLLATPASAQQYANDPRLVGQPFSEDSGFDAALPRDERVGFAGGPNRDDCRKTPCLYLVNVSGYRVTEFRFAKERAPDGAPKWSGNQFGPDFAFNSKHWTAWYKPKKMGCLLAIQVVMQIDGKPVAQAGEFDVCTNPRLLFYINDPRTLGTNVQVDSYGPVGPAKP